MGKNISSESVNNDDTVDLSAIGRVFDVIGPVTRPYYVIRFNSNDHAKSKGVSVGQDIYFSPKSEHTSFVFLEQLMKMKISDASWKDDEEPPPQFIEYSDDEQEREAKRERKAHKKQTNNDHDLSKRPRTDDGFNQQQFHSNGDSRNSNGLYSQSNNPFYRQSRSYDPRGSGPIKWSGYNVPQQVVQQQPYQLPHQQNYQQQHHSPQFQNAQVPNFSVPPPSHPHNWAPTWGPPGGGAQGRGGPWQQQSHQQSQAVTSSDPWGSSYNNIAQRISQVNKAALGGLQGQPPPPPPMS